MNARFTLAPALAALVTTMAAQAQTTPAAYLERSQVLPTGNVIHAYRVPTTDINGKIRYWDVEMTLSVNDQGRIAGSVVAASVPSLKVPGNKFVSGTYKDTNGATCTVGFSILGSGRQLTGINCTNTLTHDLSSSWTTGLIEGHPFELDLRAAGIDQIPGYEDFAWGKNGAVTTTQFWGCMSTGEIVSAAQSGDQLVINGYDKSNIQLCGVTLTRQP